MVGLGVLEAHWRQGIGGALLAAAEAWAQEHDIHRIELTVRTTNVHAIRVYERAGFEREGLKRHAQRMADEYIDEYLMAKLLTA